MYKEAEHKINEKLHLYFWIPSFKQTSRNQQSKENEHSNIFITFVIFRAELT